MNSESLINQDVILTTEAILLQKPYALMLGYEGQLTLRNDNVLEFKSNDTKHDVLIEIRDIGEANFNNIPYEYRFQLTMADGTQYSFKTNTDSYTYSQGPFFILSFISLAKNLARNKSYYRALEWQRAISERVDPSRVIASKNQPTKEFGNNDFKKFIKWSAIVLFVLFILIMLFASLPIEIKNNILGIYHQHGANLV